MALFLVFAGFAAIYLGVPWLIARLARDILHGVTGFRSGALTFVFFCGALAWVWQLRSDPDFFFHADQLGGYRNPVTCEWHGDETCMRARAHWLAQNDSAHFGTDEKAIVATFKELDGPPIAGAVAVSGPAR